jgi:peptidyl-prolyl cis-trans isomerase SurA
MMGTHLIQLLAKRLMRASWLTTAGTGLLVIGLHGLSATGSLAQQPAELKPSVAVEQPSVAGDTAAKSAAVAPSQEKSATVTKKPAAAGSVAAGKRKAGQSIVVLVGDEPITAYEVEQRQRLMAQSAGIGDQAKARFQALVNSEGAKTRMKEIQEEVIRANQGKSRDEIIAIIKSRMQAYGKQLQQQAVDSVRGGAVAGMRQRALETLIDERLMLQEAKRVGTLMSEEDLDKQMAERAKRGSMTPEQYKAQFKSLGVDIETVRSTLRAQASWIDAIKRKFGYQIQVTEREVDRVASSRPKDGEDDVELQLQRITLPTPEKLDQKIMGKRFQEAEEIWRRFNGCKSLPALTAGAAGARLENLGPQRPANIPEPTRGLLLGAAENSMAPPSVGQNGIELWAVCGRSVVKADDKQREVIENQLRREQFGLLADRHLKDLRKDTPIEYR